MTEVRNESVSARKSVWRSTNGPLIRWLMRKYAQLAAYKTRAAETPKRLAQNRPTRSFIGCWDICHKMDDESRMN
jgi:hypothetical protein